jgi:antigen flippase
VGAVQVFTILINIFRIKVIAFLLGPAGLGIIGMFQSATDLVKQITSFGIAYSGVKEIADVTDKGDQFVSRKVKIVKRWSLYSGILGMFVTLVLCMPLSFFAFNSNSYALSIAVLSLTLLLSSVSYGQLTILQGLRKINQSSKATVTSAITSLLFSVPLYWFFGEDGIVPSLILISATTLASSWYYTRSYSFVPIEISFRKTIEEGLTMAKLGFFILVTSVVVTFTTFIIRATVSERMDLNAVGCFNAVFSITSIYLGIIYSAMQLDFYPKLSALNSDEEANKLMNEQVEVALLVSVPALMLLIVFSKFVIHIALSPSFLFGTSVMQWQFFGGFFGIISWALGVMFLARGKGFYSLISEGLWCFVYYFFIHFAWGSYGFLTLGIGYLIAGVFRLFLVLYFVKLISSFSFERSTFQTTFVLGILVSALFMNMQLLSGPLSFIFAIILVSVSFYFCFQKISTIVNIQTLFKKMSSKFGVRF